MTATSLPVIRQPMTVRITLLVALLGFSLPILGQRPSGVIVNVNAASYSQPILARGSLVAAFGRNLASGTATGERVPFLLGTQVFLEAADGLVVAAPLLFVSPGQVNYLIPNELTYGVARVELRTQAAESHVGYIEVVDGAPGLFTQNVDGKPIVRAFTAYDSSIACDPNCHVSPLAYGLDGRIDIEFLGTGWRNCSPRGGLRLTLNGRDGYVPSYQSFPTNPSGIDFFAISPVGIGWDGWYSVQLKRGDQTSNVGHVLIGSPR